EPARHDGADDHARHGRRHALREPAARDEPGHDPARRHAGRGLRRAARPAAGPAAGPRDLGPRRSSPARPARLRHPRVRARGGTAHLGAGLGGEMIFHILHLAESLMNYEPSDRFMHRLNPITKMAIFLLVVIGGMYVSGPDFPWELNAAVFVVLVV